MKSVYRLFEKEYQFQTIPELVKWAKTQKLIEKDYRKPSTALKDGEYAVPFKKLGKIKKINKKTGRIKNMVNKKYLITHIKPEDRTLINLPKYSNKKPKVKFQDWLCLKKSPKLYPKLNNQAWGWSPNEMCYGWSHRAIGSFKIGTKITNDTGGNWKSKSWTIKSNKDVEKMAKSFAKFIS